MLIYSKELSDIFTNWKQHYQDQKTHFKNAGDIKKYYILKFLNILKNIAQKNIKLIPIDKDHKIIVIQPLSKL